MRLLVLQVIAISALYQAAWAYEDLSPEEKLALYEMLAEARVGDLYYNAYNPEIRNEDPDTNRPVIPPNTAVAGGAGEGKQHLGPNLVPNKQRIVPEINPPVYANPPNPCALQDLDTHQTEVTSETKAELGIICLCEEGWEVEEVDCAEAVQCCIPSMPNEASFVKQFQEAGEDIDDNDIFQNIYSKRTRYHEGEKRDGHVAKKSPIAKRSSMKNYVDGMAGFHPASKLEGRMDRRNKYFAGPMKKYVVAKKAPHLAGGRLPVM